jgi:hypothetical protein
MRKMKHVAGKTVALKKSSGTTSDKDGKPAAPSNLWVLREIADTTWRMTIPVVIFTFIGIFIDLKLGTSPWITFVDVLVGFFFDVLFV